MATTSPGRLVIALLAAVLLGACASTPPAAPAAVEEPLVVVAGASGRTGKFVLRRLAAGKWSYRPLTRSRVAAVKRLGPEFAGESWVEADVRDPFQLAAALAGADYVISVIGTTRIKGPESAEFVDNGGVKNLVDAAVREGVQHFVLLTAMGVTDASHPLNKLTNDTLVWRLRGEDYLRASGLNYTIVRPAGLREEPSGTWALRFEQGDHWKNHKGAILSRDDAADLMVEALKNPALRNVTLEAWGDPAVAAADWRADLPRLRPDEPRPGN
jgi:uncharacterized protein YbjT (DUF2867 family)